jgi:hypothetical protein
VFDKYQFTKDWTNPSDFPTVETDETKVRSDAQLLHNETKNALHKLIDDLAAETAGENIGVVGEGGASTLQAVLGALLLVKHSHGNLEELERLVAEFNGMGVTQSLVADASKIPTSQAVVDQLDALGAGDMMARVYDPHGKETDIFAYADTAVSNVTAESVGLGNVNNTSDMDKPISTAQATAIEEAKQMAREAGGKAEAISLESLGAVSKNGDTMNGGLTINDSQNKALAITIDRTINGTHYKLESSPSSAAGNFYYEKGSEVVNKLQLTADSTVLGKPLTIASGGTGATTAADARTNLGINYTIYKSLSEIGLSGKVTMNQVCSALPQYSCLMVSNSTSSSNSISDVPCSYGFVEIIKNGIYGHARATRGGSASYEYYLGAYYGATDGSYQGFSGWTRMMPNVLGTYEHGTALPTSGFTKGRIFFKKVSG